jgi:LysM repeat protein
MNDDLEHTLRDSLDRHAVGASASGGNVDDVYRRADRRHARRRSMAVIGSIAALIGGVVGFAMFAAGDGDSSEVALEAGTGLPEMPTTTMTIPTAGVGWSCSGYLGSDGYRTYFSDCFQTTWTAGPPGFCTTTTVPVTTIPPATAPATNVANATAEAVLCTAPATGYQPECLPTVSTTTSPASTTTSIGVGIGTLPGPSNPAEEAVACTTYSFETAPPTTVPTPMMSEQVYVVVAGDSLLSIAGLYGMDVETLVNYNAWVEGVNHPIFVGDVVKIPPGAAIPSG